MTLPGGKREGFTFKGVPQTLFYSVLDYLPSFVPDPGVYDQLIVSSTPMLLMDGVYVTEGDTSGGLNDYNPADPTYGGAYELLTPQGITYTIDANQGVLSTVADRNGNSLTFTDSGITSSTGVGITFTRDPFDRIIGITDPSGMTIHYGYSPSGDLAWMTDRDGATTQFFYNATHPHYLDHIVDAEQHTVLQVNYDPTTGRLIGLTNASGNSSSLQTNLAGLTETVTDALQNPTTVTYDDNGNVVQSVDAQGNTTKNQYDPNNNLTSSELISGPGSPYPLDRTTTYSYDQFGDLLTETDPMKQVTRTTYNQFGEVLTSSDALGNTTRNTYDPYGNLIETTGPATTPATIPTQFQYDSRGDLTIESGPDGTTIMGYNTAGDLISSTSPTGVTTDSTYDASGNQTGTSFVWIDPNNPADTQTVTTSETYNGNGQVLTSTDEYGHISTTTYTADGQVQTSTDVLGNTTTYVYNSAGQVIETDYPGDTQNPAGTISRSVYDADGRVIAQDDPHVPGQMTDGTLTTYNSLGQVVETQRVTGLDIELETVNGAQQSYVNGNPTVFSTTTTTYDAAGEVKTSTEPNTVTTGPSPGTSTTTYVYNADGEETQETDALGNVTQFAYDGAGRQTSETSAARQTTQMIYDADGRLIKTIYPDETVSTTTYNSQGLKATETDQAGLTTSYNYDAYGRLSSVVEPAVLNPVTGQMVQPTTVYGYDPYGNMTSVTDALSRVTTYTLNQFGQQVSETLPLGQTETTSYDSFGRVSVQTDFAGQQAVTTYDSLGRVESQDYYAAGASMPGETMVYQYDALGRQSQITDTTGTYQLTETFGYDLENDLTSVATQEGTTQEGTVNYVYDRSTDEHTETYTANTETDYGYDALGRLSTVTVSKLNGQPLSTPLVTNYYYSPVSAVAYIVYPNGTLTAYGYDSQNRITGVTNAVLAGYNPTTGLPTAGELLSTYAYTLNADGLRTQDIELELESGGTYSTRTFSWTYDNLQRLTEEQLVSTLSGESYTTNYVYDLVGNRVSMSTVTGPTTDQTTQTVTYVYDANDELKSDAATVSTNGGTPSQLYTTSYTYDFNGSETLVSQVRATGSSATYETDHYTYNLRNELATADISRVESGQQVTISASYVYDDEGIRVEGTVGTTIGQGNATTTVTQYLIDRQNPTGSTEILEEHQNGSPVPSVTYFSGAAVLGQVIGSGAGYLMPDGQGSTRLVVDPNAIILARYVYDAYGSLLGAPVGVTNQPLTVVLFVGQRLDPVLREYYLRARYYAAGIGRFTTADSFPGDSSDPLTFQKYVYASADPINLYDPTGHDGELIGTLLAVTIVTFLFTTLFCGCSPAPQPAATKTDSAGVILTGSEAPYDPAVWDAPNCVMFNNCYAYAANNRVAFPTRSEKPQPGIAGGRYYGGGANNTVAKVKAAAVLDGFTFLGTTPDSTLKCPKESYVVALVVAPGVDYHWYRHNPDGTWSGKPGSGLVTDKDASGNLIKDPRSPPSNRNYGFANYTVWGGYFAVPAAGIRVR